jgi:4-carboxymuconolactone decarboxylase
MVSPALERYMRETLFGDLWKRPDLDPRDRSIVTLAVLIGRNQTIELPTYMNLALDQGVTPAEISEIITHLAFYSGSSNAIAAVAVAAEIFAERGIGTDQLPPASPDLLPLDRAAEEQRADESTSVRSAHARGVLRRLAQCDVGGASIQNCLRQPVSVRETLWAECVTPR